MTAESTLSTAIRVQPKSCPLLSALAFVFCLASSGSVAQEEYPPPVPASAPQIMQPTQPQEAPPSQDGSAVTQSGDLYRARLAGIEDFHAVVDILRAELFQRGWTEQEQIDVDIMLRSEGMLLHNKLITVYDPERFAEAIARDPGLTQLAAEQILVYKEKPDRALSYRAKPGDIVIEMLDPTLRARALGFDDEAALEALREELVDAIAATDNFFRGPESLPAAALGVGQDGGTGDAQRQSSSP